MPYRLRSSIAAVGWSIALLAATPSLGWSQSLESQLNSAVQAQNWDQAIKLVDQMIQSQPQRRQELEAYKTQLFQLKSTSGISGSSDSVSPQDPGSTNFGPEVQKLPPILESQLYQTTAGDYLSAISGSSERGYLRWATYPIGVYIQSDNRTWYDLVSAAIQNWSRYIPLTQTSEERADIRIRRMPNQGVIAGIAKSRDFYIDANGALQHRVDVTIGEYPSAGPLQVSVVATHELGHALGLWGHSPDPDDIMFFSVVNLRATITPRDVNTLRKVYEQPTLIGVKVPPEVVDLVERGSNLAP